MPAMKYFLKLSEVLMIVTLPARKIIYFSIMSVLCHRGTPRRRCAHTQMHTHRSLLSCLVNYSFLSCPYTYPTAFDKAAIIKPLFSFNSRLHNIKMMKGEEEAISEGATIALKSTEIAEEQESIEILFCNIGDVRCGVLYGTSTFHPHFADLNRHCACC